MIVVDPLIAGQEVSPLPQDIPVAQASCRLPPQGTQTVVITGLTVKPDEHGGPLGHTGSLLPPQMNSQRVMSALSRKPMAQAVGRQVPVEHETAVLLITAPVLQAVPQVPQLVAVLSASQPLRALPSHWPKPVAQVMLHIPSMQVGVPPVEEQAIPQPPQWLTLLLVLTQPAPEAEQSVVAPEQLATHAPDEQRVPAPQTVPQPPQLLLSDCRLTQMPLQET